LLSMPTAGGWHFLSLLAKILINPNAFGEKFSFLSPLRSATVNSSQYQPE